MAKNKEGGKPFEIPRPEFPKRAVITGGMPYGNKELHFGHVGGMFVFADAYARFLRDRIGKENVLFVGGTDCYGSPIAEGWRKKVADGEFEGSLTDFVQRNHDKQQKTLDDYGISPDIFAASGLSRSKEIHAEVTDWFISSLYKKGQLNKISTMQFYDEKAGCFLNGRQVIGKCPIEGCTSEKGYADECDLGHQYMPENLIDPVSTLTGEKPSMRPVTNWYFKLRDYEELLKNWIEMLKKRKDVRPVVCKTIEEFLKPPVIYIKREFEEKYLTLKDQMPEHEYFEEAKKPSFTVQFKTLSDCDEAVKVLVNNGIRYRTGKTLVPFRLTGNIEWGVPAPVMDDVEGLTVWVWPESLWAPISFTQTLLEQRGRSRDEWKDYWCSKDSGVYQFIGQDNIYFYGIAEPAMWMAQQESAEKTADPAEGEMQMPTIIANHHILFLDKKASSSGAVKPPMADDLLNFLGIYNISDRLTGIITTLTSDIMNLIWKCGIQIILFLSALQGIPYSAKEAASMEGATAWEYFWKITVPYISPMLVAALVYTIVDSFVDPSNEIMKQVLSQSTQWKHGYSAALAWAYFAIIGGILAIVIAIINKFVYYEVE